MTPRPTPLTDAKCKEYLLPTEWRDFARDLERKLAECREALEHYMLGNEHALRGELVAAAEHYDHADKLARECTKP